MKFRKGNKILYNQDFRRLCGLPHGVEFKVSREESTGFVTLTAKGYGDLKNGYGNGKLCISKAFASKAVWDRIKRETVWDKGQKMTKKEKEQEKEYRDVRNDLINDIYYETAAGVHTYHQCDCNTQSCRRKCLRCLVNDFLDWKDFRWINQDDARIAMPLR